MANTQKTQTRPAWKRVLGIIRFVILIPITLYILIGLIYFAARFTVGESLFIVTIGNLLLHWFLLIALILLPITIILQAWAHGVLVSVFVIAFAVLYGGLFLPSPPPDPLALAQVRVMTYNTGGRRTTPDDLATVIEQTQPDIIGLMELSQDTLRFIRSEYVDIYPNPVITFGSDDTKALLSKYPITAEEIFTLETTRTNIEATVQIANQPTRVFVVHPPSPDRNSSWNFYLPDPDNAIEIENLLARIPTTQSAILLGDFNITDQSSSYAQIRSHGFRDAFREVGFGFGGTYNLRPLLSRRSPELASFARPVTRIDYIWHTDNFKAVSAITGPETFSDHQPVIADLRLP